jgi:hypothetical protein
VNEYPVVQCEAVKWEDDSFPGWIGVVLIDTDGRRWKFVDKWPMFGFPNEEPTEESIFPVAAFMRVTVEEDGDPTVVITRDVESEDGVSRFRVPSSAVIR